MVAYAFRGPARYHVPGPQGRAGRRPGVRKAIGADALAADVPQDIHGIDLGPSPTPYERAERLAAEAFGAERSWFLTNGATQGNHALCLALAPLGTKIVAQRNSHTSIVDGLVLSGGIPSFVAPEYDAELGITHAVTPDALAAALREAPDARAAFIVSPTYYGMAADVAGLPRSPTRADVPLVVDQSWGPHFGFHEELPPTALSQGADAMLTSTHKIAGSLTQSAMLHVGNRSGRDRSTSARSPARSGCCARRARRRSCSPRSTAPAGSSSSTASSSCTRRSRRSRSRGRSSRRSRASRSSTTGSSGGWASRATTRCGSSSTSAGPGAPATRSPMRCAAPTTSTSSCPTQATLVFVVGLGESAAALRRLAATSTRPSSASRAPGTTAALVGPTTTLRNEVAVPPREAFLGEAEQLAVDDAVGRISCEAIACYPPGVPALLPGERISAETVAYLRELAAGGARLHGASDPRFQTINVLREAAMIDPLERWARVRREARFRGPAHLRRRCPTTQDPAELRGFDVAVVGAPTDDLVSDRPGTRFAPRAIRAASCPPGPHLEVGVDAFAALRIVDFGDAPVLPGRPAAHAPGDRGDRRPGARRRRDPGRARRRPRDHRAVVRACAAVHGPVGLIHFDTHTDTGAEVFGVEISHGTFIRRLVDEGASTRPATRRSACAATGRARPSSPGRPSAASRACSPTTSATSASARSSRARSRPSAPGRCT